MAQEATQRDPRPSTEGATQCWKHPRDGGWRPHHLIELRPMRQDITIAISGRRVLVCRNGCGLRVEEDFI